ncbi:MAG: CehA/McbA family metallohydrolase [Bryobacterales bacterium]|nr:CehA/McbA family metallohydrolase [Bryobacterales bacterium]
MPRNRTLIVAGGACCLCAALLACTSSRLAELRGVIVDSSDGSPVAARLYIQDGHGEWHVAQSADPDGSSVPYNRSRSDQSVEIHTTLSAHSFAAKLPPGSYSLTAARGKEYLPATNTVVVGEGVTETEIRLRRWINMAEHGWYSGETHVHRSVSELPGLVVAEDLNVALPLTYWVTEAGTPPSQGDKNSAPVQARPITVDPFHIIYPMNTEYEIFTVSGVRHTLGAVFALNHRSVLNQGAPPVGSIAKQVHDEGGLLELDKHNWPWSMMLIPVMNVDLYELTNNHIWRAPFHFRGFGEQPADYMQVEQTAEGFTEEGWIDFTFQNYYALLNCGFRLRPTAGTASGVHPVPLGFGRVYVHLGSEFSYERWIKGLDAGRSFVTTGPMLDVRVNDRLPGREFAESPSADGAYRLTGWIRSATPVTSIEVVEAGEVVRRLEPANQVESAGGYLTLIDEQFSFDTSTWLAVRCYERPEGRLRFAHSAPFHITVPDRPLRPRREEVEYLIGRVESELARHQGVLPEAAIAEYEHARSVYEQLKMVAE